MTKTNHDTFTLPIVLISTILLLVLLYFGVTMSMFSVHLVTHIDATLAKMSVPLLSRDLSIVGTIKHLHQTGHQFVGVMIALFSIVVPVLKTMLVLLHAYLSQKTEHQLDFLAKLMALLGKWSMADVMVVATFLSYLSSTGNEAASHHALKVFGMEVQISILPQMKSSLGQGFWIFLSYCLLSLLFQSIYLWYKNLLYPPFYRKKT